MFLEVEITFVTSSLCINQDWLIDSCVIPQHVSGSDEVTRKQAEMKCHGKTEQMKWIVSLGLLLVIKMLLILTSITHFFVFFQIWFLGCLGLSLWSIEIQLESFFVSDTSSQTQFVCYLKQPNGVIPLDSCEFVFPGTWRWKSVFPNLIRIWHSAAESH